MDASGAPVVGARVELQRVLSYYERSLQIANGRVGWEAETAVRTSSDGGFRLSVPRSGMWQVEVSAAGKVPMRIRLIPVLEDGVLPAVVLDDDVGIEVRVMDDEGSPVAGAQVWVQRSPDPSLRSRRRQASLWGPVGRYGRTGDDGRVRLTRKAGQRVRVHAFATGFLPAESAENDASRATLRLLPGKPVKVTVRTAEGDPVAGAPILVSSLGWVATLTGEGGQALLFAGEDKPLPLTLRLPAGEIERSVLSPVEQAPADAGEITVTKEWRLESPVVLAGGVIASDTREPVSGALVWSRRDPGSFVTSGPDGGYSLKQSLKERWFLAAGAPGYARSTIEVARDAGRLRVPTLVLPRAGELAGQVVDPEGEAIAGAVIRVTGEPGAMAFSDAGGWFRSAGLTMGKRYEVAIGATGYAPDYRRVIIEPDRDLEIVLQPGRSVIGRLVTPDREPVAAGRVYLVPIDADPRLKSFSAQTERMPKAESDAEGRFRLEDLPPGGFALVARRDDLTDKIVRDVDLSDTDVPRDLGDLELGWGVELHGFVRSRDGEPIPSATLAVSTHSTDRVLFELLSEEARGRTLITGEDGEFTIDGLAEASMVNISVQHEEYIGTWLSEIDPKAEQPIEILLDKGARLTGRVLDESRRPVAGVRVMATTVARSPLSPHADSGAFQRSDGVSRSDGTFEVKRIAPGRVEVSARSSEGLIARERLELDLSAGEQRSGVVLRVSAGATLTGTVTGTEGSPVEGAQVRVMLETSFSTAERRHADSGRMAGAATDADGYYSIRGLNPEASRAIVSVHHPEYAPAETSFELRPGRNRRDIELESGGHLSGLVLNDGGEPVEGAEVSVTRREDGDSRSDATTSGSGAFEIKGLSLGGYEIRARRAGYAESSPQEVEVSGTVGASVVLRLRRGGTIRGRILGLDSGELAEASLDAWSEDGAVLVSGIVGDNGDFRIANVGFSEGQVGASSQLRGQSVSVDFTLDINGGETWVELDFETGSILTGLVLLNGEALARAHVVVHDGETGFGSSETNAAGRFRIGGLPDGPVEVRVDSMGLLSHTETLEIAGDREVTIDISSVRVLGRVVAEEDRAPISGAQVWAMDGDDLLAHRSTASALATAGGEFELFLPENRRVEIRARAQGFVQASLDLDTGSGSEISGVELALAPASTLNLEVTLWNGGRPRHVWVTLLDEAGRELLDESLFGVVPGRFRLASGPAGDWTLLIAATDSASAAVELPVRIPGAPVAVTLPQGAVVSVEIPSAGAAPGARVRLVSSTGKAFRLPSRQMLDEFPLYGGRAEIHAVPAGDWTVEVEDSSGGVRIQAVTVVPGETVSVRFE